MPARCGARRRAATDTRGKSAVPAWAGAALFIYDMKGVSRLANNALLAAERARHGTLIAVNAEYTEKKARLYDDFRQTTCAVMRKFIIFAPV